MDSHTQNKRMQLERELNVDFPPGTELLSDFGDHNFVRAKTTSNIVLVPQPSQDPHDPLNWSLLWKTIAIAITTMNSFAQGLGPLALAPIFPELIEAFHHDLPDTIQLVGVSILILGFSNFIWVPMSETFGRRSVLILSILISFGSSIWRARAATYASFMGASILNGISAGPGETIQPAVLADLFFLHERGRQSTLYFAFYFGSLMVGPIISGPMAAQVGWRNFWWLNTTVLGLTAILTIFLFPETKWDRDSTGIDGITTAPTVPSVPTKHGGEATPMTVVEKAESNISIQGRGRPSKAQFRLFQRNPAWTRTLAVAFWLPWKLHAFPIVQFAAFVVSWTASSFLVVNVTQSEAFAAPPYNYSSQTIGFFNFACLAGAFIGLITAGPLSDWISMRLTIRNNGIREPEMRLPTLIPYLVINVLGQFVLAFGYQYHWPWPAIVVIGFGCAGLQVASLPAIASAYAIDSYKPAAGSIFVAITVNKNLWGYGITKFMPVWIQSSGFVKPIMTNMCLTVLWCSFGVLFWFKGKTFRRWTRNSNVHQDLDQWVQKRY